VRVVTPLWANDVYGEGFAIISPMPLTKNVGKNVRELLADNKKKGKARGANGKLRSRKQIIAISHSAAGKKKTKKKSR